jgi:S1-C subfamily serine protease
MKRLVERLIACALALTAINTASAMDSAAIHEVRTKVVELRIVRADVKAQETKKKNRHARIENLPNYGVCSGVVVSSIGDILTARHCTDGAARLTVAFSDGKEYVASVVATSKRHDLALIHVDRFNTPHITIATSTFQGQHIYVMGNPLGIAATLTEGIVAKQTGDVDLVDVTVLPGNSGGPAFNERGELVGITTAGIVVLYGFAHLNIMQSIDAIRGFGLEIRGIR